MSAAPVLARSQKFKVTLLSQGKTLDFEKPLVRVGRDEDNDIIIANDPKVSRHHLEFHFQKGQLIVKNVSKKNLVHVNEVSVQEHFLENFSKIRLGDTEMQVIWEDAVSSQAVVVPAVNDSASPVVPTPPPPWVNNQIQKPPSMNANSSLNMGSPMSARPRNVRSSGGSNRLTFYGIIIAIGIGGYLLFGDSGNKRKAETSLRKQEEVAMAIEKSATAVKEITTVQDRAGRDTIQYRAAEENYIKGFRDYRNGQYARAMQAFQAALSFYPNHEMAKKYWTLSKRKFDEMVQVHMVQGRKYLGKNNFRLCKASFSNAMVMLKDSNDPVFKEAKQFYDECSLRLERGS